MSGCPATASMNVTSGSFAADKRFVVTAADCCNYCATTPHCIAATYANYYCQPFSTVVAMQKADGVSILASPSPPMPTSAPPTPAPPPPAPIGFALLSTSQFSSSCLVTSDFSTVTQVFPLGSCQEQTISTSAKVEPLVNGVWLYEYGSSNDCTGAEKKTWFPSTCTWTYNGDVHRMGQVLPPANASTNQFLVEYNVCDVDCLSGCNAMWSGNCGVCNQGAAGSSSGSSGSASGPSPSWMVLCDSSWASVFHFPNSSSCEGPNTAVAYPCGGCFTSDESIPRIVTCTKT